MNMNAYMFWLENQILHKNANRCMHFLFFKNFNVLNGHVNYLSLFQNNFILFVCGHDCGELLYNLLYHGPNNFFL